MIDEPVGGRGILQLLQRTLAPWTGVGGAAFSTAFGSPGKSRVNSK
jgi:hypothetical protein